MFMYESAIGRFMTKVFDLLVLNILFLLTSFPLLTIGSSMAALNVTVLKMVQKKETSVCKCYLKAFRANLKQGTVVWISLLLFFGVLLHNLHLMTQYQGISTILGFLTSFFLVILCIYSIYLFPLLGTFKTDYFQLLKNTGLIAISFFPYTILLITISFGPMLGSIFLNPQMYGILIYCYLLIGISLTEYLKAIILNRIFQPLADNYDSQ